MSAKRPQRARRSSECGFALGIVLCWACGGSTERAPVEMIPPPDRTAAEDASLRALLADVAERKLCDSLSGSFVALPDDDAAQGADGGTSAAAGRLHIEECEVRRDRDRLALRLAGRGFTWVEQTSAGPAGSSFAVRGHLRFRTAIDLTGRLDVAYAPDRRVVSLWMTPESAASATVTPTSAIPVAPEGGWSSFIAAVGGVLGPSIEERARPMVEEQGSARMSERLTRGFTFTVDLCNGQTDSIVGPLANGETPRRPYESDGTPWLANQRVRLRAGGIDASGPFESSDAPLRLDVEVESGAAIELRAYCEDDAREVLDAFLSARPSDRGRPSLLHRVELGAPTFLELDATACPLVIIATPLGAASEPVVFRYRVTTTGEPEPPIVRCE